LGLTGLCCRKLNRFIYILVFSLLILPGCKKELLTGLETPDWTDKTHGNSADPDYSIVFPDDEVLRFDITIDQADWTRMQIDLNTNIKTVASDWTPVWVPCSFKFDGIEWYKVGIRYKGNSSLKECVRRGIKKYSLKLDFDEFEDDFPAIENQRFYGFKQLNLANGFDDMSLMREKTASDLFRSFGIPSARTVFCEVWIDTGNGSKYFGLYTLVEEVDDTVIETQFEEGGNLYKPEGPPATFAGGTFNILKYDKKTNLEDNDYTDVRTLYDVINSSLRTTDHQSWKASLENIFAVQHFIKWLAANTVIQNWDTYGKMSHNYYLYNDPSAGKLTWIPWDNNESLCPGKEGGALSLPLSEVTEGWPLIRFLIDDDSYNNIYRGYTASFINGPFSVSFFDQIIDNQTLLIRKSAKAEVTGYTFLPSPSVFDQAVTDLKQHVRNRNDAVNTFLATAKK
jgi:spore coat protein H